jgi:hypothetical protein
MSIRLPLTTVLDVTDSSTGSTSTLGGIAYPFKIPQDTDNVVMAFSPSVVSAGISAVFQTSPDGGTTWYDVARTSIASASPSGVGPQWVSIPTIAQPVVRASIVAVGSVVAINTIGTAAASTLSSGQYSGLPILGLQNRVFLIQQSGISASQGSRVQVLVNNQSATA